MFQSDTFSDVVEEMYDSLEEDTKDLIQKRLAEAEIDKDDNTFSFLKNIL
jgi:hypothetical protein